MLIALASLPAGRGLAQTGTVDFQRDVGPILAEHCSHCHGTDEGSRQSGLRLTCAMWCSRGESGDPAIVAGQPEKSALVAECISAHDPDQIMPPPKENKPLNAKQIETLKLWISQGASYATHWAFVAPQKVKLPAAGPANPIDALVAAKLKSLGLEPSVPAAQSTLCRRL